MVDRESKYPLEETFFLFGPRQTGKTTLLKGLFSSDTTKYYNLLLNSEYTKFLANPEILREEILALSPNITHVFIDEVQRVPALLDEIQALIDEKIPQHFVLSGSSARKLKRGRGNLLAGRAWNFRLFPLTALELGDLFNLSKALTIGTLPGVYLRSQRQDALDTLRAYVEVYLREEIEAEAISRNLGGFIRFLRVASQMNGEIINYSNIARDVGISSVTVKEYFKILEDTLVGSFLFPFHHSERKKYKLSPKFYFFDTGVLRATQQRLELEVMPATYEFGNYFETWLINEVQKINHYLKKDWSISFLRTASDVEVDLIIETPRSEMIAVEIKSKPTPQLPDFASGFSAISKVKPDCKCICVCTGSSPRKVEKYDVLPYLDFLNLVREL